MEDKSVKKGFIHLEIWREEFTPRPALLVSYGDQCRRLVGCGGPYTKMLHKFSVTVDELRDLIASHDDVHKKSNGGGL